MSNPKTYEEKCSFLGFSSTKRQFKKFQKQRGIVFRTFLHSNLISILEELPTQDRIPTAKQYLNNIYLSSRDNN